jgi:hypothetical protein
MAALVYLALFVSIFAYLLWFHLLNVSGATAASSYHFLMPPLGMLFGWLLLGEQVAIADILGIVPAAIGIYVVTRPSRSINRGMPCRCTPSKPERYVLGRRKSKATVLVARQELNAARGWAARIRGLSSASMAFLVRPRAARPYPGTGRTIYRERALHPGRSHVAGL